MPKVLNFKTIIEQDEKDYFVASVPSIPGCHSQGKTYEEVLANIKEAIGLCLEVAGENSSYKAKISFPREKSEARFLGVTEVAVPSYSYWRNKITHIQI